MWTLNGKSASTSGCARSFTLVAVRLSRSDSSFSDSSPGEAVGWPRRRPRELMAPGRAPEGTEVGLTCGEDDGVAGRR
ncbi:hypothetical protein NL676_038203 [Syzygium grande]|nr:hypothetical protein NL676_038203 [Syzygium grande]